jgi:16S rRNA (cytosine967-C5)-methyltransferase
VRALDPATGSGPDVRDRPGVAARRAAADALLSIEQRDAYANVLLPRLLDRSPLDPRDRSFVTELVYGTIRMRRACDFLVDRFTVREPDMATRTWLRLGAYQLAFTDVPAHAAVSATVDAVPRKVRGFVNAVLRKVADAPVDWPSDAVRLSCPDWIVDRLTDDLGSEAATSALAAMNDRPAVTRRADGYVQDLASQWVAALVEAHADERVLDAAAAPGGKATALARSAARVTAADVRPSRANQVAQNRVTLGLDNVDVVVADGRRAPFPPRSFDRVLLDAPCSGLGTLRRRPDARWRVDADDVSRLAVLQRQMVDALLPLVRPGGTFVYSVCTLTRAETEAVDAHLADLHADLTPLPAPRPPWRPLGRGARLLPQDAGTDGMYILRLQVPG